MKSYLEKQREEGKKGGEMKGMSRSFSRLISMLLVLALIIIPFANLAYAAETINNQEIKQKIYEQANQWRKEYLQKHALEAKKQQLTEKYQEFLSDRQLPTSAYQADDVVRVIIELNEAAVMEDLLREGLSLENVSSSRLQTMENQIQSEQLNLIDQLKYQRINFSSKHQFKYLLNAISGDVKYGEIDRIKRLPGVADVKVANEYYPDTVNTSDPEMFFSAPLVGAQEAWTDGYDGSGIVVAILDTGVNYFHPAFGGDGKETLSLGSKTDRSPETGDGTGYTERVIGGYNWADDNNDIVDRTDSQHGVHVAGTVAGNDPNSQLDGQEFKGLAPEAKILAEKVFSNDPDRLSAMADEIIAGIEHAVANGADVINMSLGSVAGAVTEDDPELLAVKNATDAGVVVSISAGNSSFSTGYYPFADNRDFAMVGSPSIAESSISVAASENSAATFNNYFSLSQAVELEYGGTLQDVPMMVADALPEPSTLTGTYEVVYAGLGAAEDFEGLDVEGKVALIQRGDYSFSEKIANAAVNGAVAAIIFNNTYGYVNMFVNGDEGIPAAFILGEHGNAIRDALDQGIPLTVTFNQGKLTVPMVEDAMTDFSSWGPEPSLNFKPTLTAPGGDIFSSVGKDDYASMSGTSMAAPHVTGASALVIESFKARNVDYTAEDVKTALSNTAKVLIDPYSENPYPVRQQGAGRIQVDKAVATNVLVTRNNGETGVALKEFDNGVTFTLTARNFGDTDVTYQLSGDAYQDNTFVESDDGYEYEFNELTLKAIEGANLTFDKGNTLVVPANSEVSFSVTLQLPDDFAADQFVDGWIHLTANEESNAPDLVVPYFGFYGDWNHPAVIDAHWADKEKSYWWMSGLYDWYWEFPLGVNLNEDYAEEHVAFSPNGDYEQDLVLPIYSFLRNAKTVEVNVLDNNHQKLRTLSLANDQRKNHLEDYYTYYSPWDGDVNGEVVPDGQYYIQTIVQPYGVGADDYQEYLYPVKVDTVQPEVTATIMEGENHDTLQIIASDDSSGIWGYYYSIRNENGIVIADGTLGEETEDGYITSVDLPKLENGQKVFVVAWDNASNYTILDVSDGPFIYYGSGSYGDYAYFDWQATDEVGDITVTVDEGTPYSIIDDSGYWHDGYGLPLDYGQHMVTVKVFDSEQQLLTEIEETFVTNALVVAENSVTVTNDQPTANIDYSVLSDRVASVSLSVYGTDQVLETQTDVEAGNYSYAYTAPSGHSTVIIEAFDDQNARLGLQTVDVNNVKLFDVRFNQDSYHVEDEQTLAFGYSVSEDTYAVTLDIFDQSDVSVIDDVYELSVTDEVYTLDVSKLTEGTYDLVLDAFDADGQSLDTATATLYLYPTGVLAYGDSNYFRTNGDEYTIHWDYDDPETVTTDVYSLYVSVNGSEESISSLETTSYTVDLNSYTDGKTANVEVYTKDASGKLNGHLFYTIVKDLSAPAWFIDNPWPYTLYNANSNLDWLFAYTFDLDLDPNSVTVYTQGMEAPIPVNVEDYYGFAYIAEEPLLFTEEGLQNVELHYSDLAGNSGYHHRKVIVDLTSPDIQLSTPNITLTPVDETEGSKAYEGTYETSSSNLILRGKVTETLSSFALYLDDDQILGSKPAKEFVNSVDERFFEVLLPLEKGMNTHHLTAVDGAGNETTIALNVERKTTSSSGGGSTPPAGQEETTVTEETDSATVTITTSENGKAVAEVKVDGEKIASQINDESKQYVEVDLTTVSTDEVGEINVSLDTDTVEALIAAGKGLTIKGDDYMIEIPASELASLKGQDGLNIRIKITPNDKTKVKIHALETANIVSKIYTIEADGNVTSPFTFTMKYSGAKDARKVSAYQSVDDQWNHVGSVMNWGEDAVKVTTTQLGTFAAIEYTKQFDDVINHWAQDAVEVMAAQHVINGMNESIFAPDDNITRAQFVKMLVEVLDIDTSGEFNGTFSDVSRDKWYAPYVEAASKAGITKGYEDGTFKPDVQLSRQDMVVMLMRALKKEMPEVLDQSIGNVPFTDKEMINDYAKEDVSLAVQNGLVNGLTDTEFAPTLTANRAQAATILYRLFFE